MRLPAALVDYTLLGGVVLLVATGLVSLLVGDAGSAWVVFVHGVAGITFVAFLAAKLYRVRSRVASRVSGVRGSLALAVVATAALGTGVAWGFGLSLTGPWTLLVVHMVLGVLVVPALVWHLRSHGYLPSREALGDRRAALAWFGAVAAGAVAYRLQETANRALDTPAANRRFTGSREEGTDAGNRFPVTSWVVDDPEPVDADEWTLRVTGLVDREQAFDYDDVRPAAERRALLDCTSGWYSDHDWQGVRVGTLLDEVGVRDGARWVQFRSVTGYRWSLPLAEARDALLATNLDGEQLSHGHGFPLRLVAAERRGFQWVKWVTELRVGRRRDRSEWVAIHVSGF